MQILVVVLAILGSCFAAPCKHTNSADLHEDQVIQMVINLADRNNDGEVSVLEITQLLLDFDENHNLAVDKHEFVHHWHTKFHDEKAFSEDVFSHFDTNNDNKVNIGDVDALSNRIDVDGNGTFTTQELARFLKAIYNAC